MRNCVCVWGRVHTLPRRLYAYNLSLPSNEGEGIIQRRHYNDVIRRNQVRWARASKRPDRTVQRHELHQTGNGMPIKRGDASSSNYTACNFSRDRWRSKIGREGGRVKWLRMTRSVIVLPPSLSFSLLFFTPTKAIKNKRVLVNRESKVGYMVYVYMYIYIYGGGLYAQSRWPRWFTFRWRDEYSFSPSWKWTSGKNGRVINVPR